MNKQTKQRLVQALLLLLTVMLSLTALCEESKFSAWEKLEYEDKNAIPDVNYRRKIVDNKGRDIRVQHGLGNSPFSIAIKRDASFQYEESEEGLITWMEEKQFDRNGHLELLIKAKSVNDTIRESDWFNPQGKRINHSEYDPENGRGKHSILVDDWLSRPEGVIVISEVFWKEDGPADSISFHYDSAGKLLYVKQQIYHAEKNSVSYELCDTPPTEAVKRMALEWFSH
ncbi:MAG: hypothetical protein ACOX58_07870 [Christensenellales bacterium]|jgi:hypothetical protein